MPHATLTTEIDLADREVEEHLREEGLSTANAKKPMSVVASLVAGSFVATGH